MRLAAPRLACLWLVVCAAATALAAATVPGPERTGSPFLKIWTSEDYGASPINWHILQHPRTGFIYVANNYGVLEFDSAAWRLIEFPNEGRARTLVLDHGGNLWAAGDDIAKLEPDANGLLRAHSQIDRLPPANREIGSIGFSAATAQLVAFASPRTLFVFPQAGGEAFSIEPATAITSLWAAGETVYLSLSGGEVLELHDRRLEPSHLPLALDEPPRSTNRIVYHVRLAADGRWRLATNRGVLATVVGAAHAEATFLAPRELFSEGQITAAVLLRDGGYACSTVREGLLVYDASGSLRQHVDRNAGLPGNRIDHLMEDSEGGLWLAQRSGVTRIQLDSPFAIHGPAQGLQGGPRALLRHDGRLFVAHSEGLAVLEENGQFHELPGMRAGANRFAVHDGRLLVTSGAIRQLLPDGSMGLLARQVLQPLIVSRRQADCLIGGSTTGLWLYRQAGEKLNPLGIVKAVRGAITNLLDTGDGYVWATNPDGTTWRVDFRAGLVPDAPARAYGPDDGLPLVRRRDEPLLFELGGALVVGSATSLHRYDSARDRFEPELRIANLDGRQLGVTEAQRDTDGNLWVRLGPPTRTIARIVPVSPDAWRLEPLSAPALTGLIANSLYPDLAARTVWLAGQGMLVSIALDWRPVQPPPPLRVFVREIRTHDGTLRFDPSVVGAARELTARQDSLSISFAAPTLQPDYRGRTITQYRTRLEGYELDWTAWSEATRRDFTNLPYRDLRFSVEARDMSGRVSPPASFAFRIAPPWWLTRAAFVAYALAFLAAVVGLFRLRTAALRRRNTQLESAVALRTRELHEQNLELARLHRLELDEKTSAQLAEEKARLEVLRYQLNPHFLFNALNSVCAQIIQDPVAARAMVVRLADFCRLTLHRPGDAETAMTLGEELRLLRAYLEIEQARLGELMQVEIESDPFLENFALPPFLLLPLVENAVKYGAATSPERLGVKLTVHRDGARGIEITVANTGEWLEPGAHSAPSTGIGLENLRQRLARYFPGAHEFKTETAGPWVVMRLRLHRPLGGSAGGA